MRRHGVSFLSKKPLNVQGFYSNRKRPSPYENMAFKASCVDFIFVNLYKNSSKWRPEEKNHEDS
jgi:hypothetical protein